MSKRTWTGKTAYAVVAMTAALMVFAIMAATPRVADANPTIAKKTGQPCSKCHSAPPTLNSYGKKYKAHHHKK